MTKADRRILELAICLAVMMHMWLFMGTRMVNGGTVTGVPVSPETRYLGPASADGTVKSEHSTFDEASMAQYQWNSWPHTSSAMKVELKEIVSNSQESI